MERLWNDREILARLWNDREILAQRGLSQISYCFSLYCISLNFPRARPSDFDRIVFMLDEGLVVWERRLLRTSFGRHKDVWMSKSSSLFLVFMQGVKQTAVKNIIDQRML